MSAEIEFVASSSASATGQYGTGGGQITTLTVPIPVEVAADDVMHVVVFFPQYQFYDRSGTQSSLLRQYTMRTPLGWRIVARGSAARRSSVQVFRRVATTEPSDLVLTINETRFRSVPAAEDEVLQPMAVLFAHRGVSTANPVPGGYHVNLNDGGSGNIFPGSIRNALDVLVSVAANAKAETWAFLEFPDVPGVGEQYPAAVSSWSGSGVATWSLIDQVRPAAVATRYDYSELARDTWFPPDGVRRIMGSISAWHAFDAEVRGNLPRNQAHPPYPRGAWLADIPRYRVSFILAEGTTAPPIGGIPVEGVIGLTGSGWYLPEYVGRTPTFGPNGSFALSPLIHQVDTELSDEYDDREVRQDPNVFAAANPCLALDANFNAVGACLTASASFAEDPNLAPYTAAMRFAIGNDYGEASVDTRTVWWSGVVRNTLNNAGLYIVELEGFWSLFNEGRINVDEAGVPIPDIVPGVLDLNVILPGGQEVETVPAGAERQQPWSSYWRRIFEELPEAAWGIGPDNTFIRGVPDEAGVIELDALDAAVLSVTHSGMILPPVVTQWWGEVGSSVVTGEIERAPLLLPRRVRQADVEDGNVIPPAESLMPSSIGPSYTIEYAGFCVPPVRVVNLPNGLSQMVASARVRITLGEEGSAPGIVTTLTTVALPFPARERRP